MTTATALAINIPLMVLFLALWAGIPLWLVCKHPDRGPGTSRTVPQYRHARRAAYSPSQTWRVDHLRPTSR
jgi:hypothetical protein